MLCLDNLYFLNNVLERQIADKLSQIKKYY